MAPPRQRAVTALAVIDDTIYAIGNFTSISSTPRNHLAAIDGHRGAVTPWNPAAECDIDALLATPAWLVAGGCYGSVGGTNSDGLAIFPATP